MKKEKFSLLLAVAFWTVVNLNSSSLYAQNSNPWPISGPVGIGTQTPSAALEIDNASNFIPNPLNNNQVQYPNVCNCTPSLKINSQTYNYVSNQVLPSMYNLFEIDYLNNNLTPPIPSPSTLFSVNTLGQTAINKATASHTLDVGGDINADGNLSVLGGLINSYTTTGSLIMNANTSSVNGPAVELYGSNYAPDPARAGSLHFVSYGNAVPPGGGYPPFVFEFINYDPSIPTWTTNVAITTDGRTFMGSDLISNYWSSMPTGYNLYVSKGILTERLKVAVDPSNGGTDWSDFVFAKNYKLMPLSKVETYVKENKHLPEIPSATEVNKDGIDVGQMDAKLLQKIEELTLYAIQQQKEIESLKGEIKEMKK